MYELLQIKYCGLNKEWIVGDHFLKGSLVKWSVVLIWDDVSFFLYTDELHYMCFPNIKSWVGYDSVPHSPLECKTGQGDLR